MTKQTTETHYVYKITNLNPTDERLYYIGVHSDENQDSINDGYMGSSNYLDEAMKIQGEEYFKKEILSTWNTREEANQEEIRLHKLHSVASNPKYYNMAEASNTGFCTFGYVTVTDLRDGENKNISKEEFYINKEFYKTSRENMIICIDIRDNSNKLVSRVDYNKYEYYKFITDGKVAVRDLRDGSTLNVTQEEYKKFSHYEAFNVGKVNVKDLRDGSHKQVSKVDFKKNDYYQSAIKGQTTVLDLRDNTIKNVSKDDYRKYDYYQSLMQDKIIAIDTRNGNFISISRKLFDSKDYYIASNSKKINILNSQGAVVYTTWGNFKIFCKENNLPYNVLYQSQLKGGLSIPLEKSKKSITRFMGAGYGDYLGWSAKKVES